MAPPLVSPADKACPRAAGEAIRSTSGPRRSARGTRSPPRQRDPASARARRGGTPPAMCGSVPRSAARSGRNGPVVDERALREVSSPPRTRKRATGGPGHSLSIVDASGRQALACRADLPLAAADVDGGKGFASPPAPSPLRGLVDSPSQRAAARNARLICRMTSGIRALHQLAATYQRGGATFRRAACRRAACRRAACRRAVCRRAECRRAVCRRAVCRRAVSRRSPFPHPLSYTRAQPSAPLSHGRRADLSAGVVVVRAEVRAHARAVARGGPGARAPPAAGRGHPLPSDAG